MQELKERATASPVSVAMSGRRLRANSSFRQSEEMVNVKTWNLFVRTSAKKKLFGGEKATWKEGKMHVGEDGVLRWVIKGKEGGTSKSTFINPSCSSCQELGEAMMGGGGR